MPPGFGLQAFSSRKLYSGDQGHVRPTVRGLLLLHPTAAIQLPGEMGTEANRRAGNDSKEEGLGVIVGLFTRTLGLNFRPKHGLSPVSHFCHPWS